MANQKLMIKEFHTREKPTNFSHQLKVLQVDENCMELLRNQE